MSHEHLSLSFLKTQGIKYSLFFFAFYYIFSQFDRNCPLLLFFFSLYNPFNPPPPLCLHNTILLFILPSLSSLTSSIPTFTTLLSLSLMAEHQSKRQREEAQVVIPQKEHVLHDDEEKVETKRRKSSSISSSSASYNEILSSFLDEEEDVPNQDVSCLMTTLQEEISSDSYNKVDLDNIDLDIDPLACTSTAAEDCTSASSSSPEGGEEDERERVMRHLLEASDDELGLPSVENGGGEDGIFNGGEVLNFGDNLWELEDETANYYTLLQSGLFM